MIPEDKNALAEGLDKAMDEMFPNRKHEMTCMGEAHKRLITACYDHGHQWGEWENMKYVSGSERTCNRCRLHVSLYPDKKSESYAIGSTWDSASVATSFINDLAYRSNAQMTGNK